MSGPFTTLDSETIQLYNIVQRWWIFTRGEPNYQKTIKWNIRWILIWVRNYLIVWKDNIVILGVLKIEYEKSIDYSVIFRTFEKWARTKYSLFCYFRTFENWRQQIITCDRISQILERWMINQPFVTWFYQNKKLVFICFVILGRVF